MSGDDRKGHRWIRSDDPRLVGVPVYEFDSSEHRRLLADTGRMGANGATSSYSYIVQHRYHRTFNHVGYGRRHANVFDIEEVDQGKP